MVKVIYGLSQEQTSGNARKYPRDRQQGEAA